MKNARFPKSAALLLGALCLVFSSCAKRDAMTFAKSFLNQPAPEISVEKWLPAKPVTEGKFLLVEFWTPGCSGCEAIRPVLNRFQEEFKDRLVVIGLTDYLSPEEAAKMQYTIAVDPQAKTAKTMQLDAAPYIFLIDPAGIVRWEGLPFALPAMEELTLTRDVVRRIISSYPARQS